MGEEVQLDFENQMFVELLAEDGLIVLARLGLQRFIVYLRHVASSAWTLYIMYIVLLCFA